MTRHSLLFFALLGTACGATPPTAPDAVPVQPPPTAGPPASGSRLARGMFTGAGGHVARGDVSLTVSEGTAVLELSSTFRASGVPDPVLYAGSSADPNFGQALRIGRHAATGAQRFAFAWSGSALPAFVILWCDRFNVPVGYAALE